MVGNVLIDVLITRDGQFPRLGGAGLNVAVLLARGGARTALVAALADDDAGRAVRRLTRQTGIELIEDGQMPATARAIVHLESAVPSYEFDLPAYPAFGFARQVVRSVSESDLVVVNAFDFSDDSQVRSLRQVLDACRGWRVIDPNIRPALLPQPRAAARSLRQLLPAVDILKVSQEDLGFLGEKAGSTGQAFLRDGLPVLFLTRGPLGAVLRTAAGLRFRAPSRVHPAEIVDTVGAGDASLAAILLGAIAERPYGPGSREALDGLSWGSHLELAMDAAAVACRHRGGPAGPGPEDEAQTSAR